MKAPPDHSSHSPEFKGLSFRRVDWRFLIQAGLFLIMFFYALSFAREFFLPVVLAWLLSFMLRPIVRAMEKFSVPKPLSAAVIIAVLIGTVSIGAVKLYEPAMMWVASTPESLTRVERKVRQLLKPAEHVSKAVEQVEKMTTIDKNAVPNKIEVKEQSLSGSIFDWTKSFFFGGVVMFVLLYFLLASGDFFVKKLIKILEHPDDKKRVIEISRGTEDNISSYLFTVTVINIGVGLAVSLAMASLGLPNPFLWGAMAGILNFVPYLGPFCCITVISFVSLLHFETPAQAVVPPLLYITLHALESYALTPTILGRRLALNPIVIFVAVIFWGWMWGIAGAIIAVPLLMAFKVFCDQVPSLAAISEFLAP